MEKEKNRKEEKIRGWMMVVCFFLAVLSLISFCQFQIGAADSGTAVKKVIFSGVVDPLCARYDEGAGVFCVAGEKGGTGVCLNARFTSREEVENFCRVAEEARFRLEDRACFVSAHIYGVTDVLVLSAVSTPYP